MFGSTKARRLSRGALALVVVAMAMLGAVAGASAASYTALGDSYAAGPLIPNQSLNPLGCLRSDHNYAHLTAAAKGLTLTDVSCSGATTNDMTETQNVEPGPNPPQFNGLNVGTEIVSVTIGGNDIGFTEIIESCITYNPFSTPCKNQYDSGGHDQLAERINNTAPKVAAVLQGIHAHAPNARVF
ncbi:MAG TPA: SGNH/GDSL hydrolase family protein, partial [Solirubrobacterales bacterium]